jgi:hypothetical protein
VVLTLMCGRDAQEALLPVLLDLPVEAVGVDHVAHVLLQPAQVLDRVLSGSLEPPLLVDVLSQVLPELVPKVADHRRRLVADLAALQRLGDPRQ